MLLLRACVIQFMGVQQVKVHSLESLTDVHIQPSLVKEPSLEQSQLKGQSC